jgi:hypothetical protein
VCFASDQSFARKAVRETGTRRCRQNTYASCIRQHRVEEHDVLIGDHGHGVSCGTWCVSVAGEANFGDHTDLINLVAAGEGIMLEAQFLFEEAMARLRSASFAARVLARRVALPLFELVAAWSKAHPSPLVADFLKTLESVSRPPKGRAGRSSPP